MKENLDKNFFASLFSKEVLKSRKSFLIIGAGKFGGAIARKLTQMGKIVLVVDKNQDKINTLQGDFDNMRCLDPTKLRELQEIEFSNFDHCVISLGSDIDSSFVTVLNVKKLSDKIQITVKSSTPQQTSILQALGVHNIVHPEQEVAKREALELVYTYAKDVSEIGSGFLMCHVDVKNSDLRNIAFKDFEMKHNNKVKIITVLEENEDAEQNQRFVKPNDTFITGATIHLVTTEDKLDEICKEICKEVALETKKPTTKPTTK